MTSWKERLKQRWSNYKKVDVKRTILDYCRIFVGTFLLSISIVVFLSPLKLAPGGVSGIAIIFHHLFGWPIGPTGICIDLPLLIIGTIWLGGHFGLRTFVSDISLWCFSYVVEQFYGYDPLITLPGTNVADPSATLILALFGAVLTGVGLGLVFRSRATSGGTDIITMIIAKYLKHIPVGMIMIFVDSLVVLGAWFAFNDWTIPLYSLLVIYVLGVVLDKVLAGFSTCKAVLIISDKYEEIRNEILFKLDRGGTYIAGEGMYSHADKKIIFTSISPKQLPQLMFFIHKIDPNAFISVINAAETIGEGFTPLKEKVSE